MAFEQVAKDVLRKLVVWISGNEADLGTSPTITAGTAAPSSSENNGSIYLRNHAGAGVVYAREAGVWTALGTGGGGTLNHAALTSNLAWATSGHTGTASRVAGFDGAGAASYYAVGADIQAYDADLAAVAALATTGIAARTAANTWTTRTLTGPAAGITVSNGDGVSGNPTLALANDLSALEGLGSTGIAVRTAADTWAQRTITGTSNQVNVSNGNGVSGNPTLSLPQDIATTSNVTFGTVTLTQGAAVPGAFGSVRTTVDTAASAAVIIPFTSTTSANVTATGMSFSAVTGRFTVTYAGTYRISGLLSLAPAANTICSVAVIKVNGGGTTQMWQILPTLTTATTAAGVPFDILLTLAAADEVTAQFDSQSANNVTGKAGCILNVSRVG
jgi:hypothetical protein